jgi:hypothetical protein
VVLIAGTSNFVNAQALRTSNIIANNESEPNAPVVSHIGTTSDMIVFSVKVPNVKGTRFSIVIKDAEGNTLFNSTYNEKNFSKKFQLPKLENDKYTFLIKNATGNASQTFEVDSHVRFVEEVVVKKIV